MPMINYAAILVAGIAHMVFGFLWYGVLFSKIWVKAMGWENKSKAEMANIQKSCFPAYIMSFLSALLVAVLISLLIMNTETTLNGLHAGMIYAFFGWLGFSFTTGVMDYMYGMRKMKLFMINYGFYLLTFILIGAIVGGWR